MKIKILETNACLSGKFNIKTQSPENGHLFVRFKTKSKVLTRDGYMYTKLGDFIFFNQNELIEYCAMGDFFNHDYFRFFLSGEEEALFTIPTSVLYKFPLSDKLESIFSLISEEYFAVSDTRERSLTLLLSLFLINSHQYVEREKFIKKVPHSAELFRLRSDILSSPQKDYKISELAKSVHMSSSYFQNSYKLLFGSTCMSDIINARIKKAAYLLSTTDKTEAEIAELCGYNSTEHFIRQFKKIKSVSPSQLRHTT